MLIDALIALRKGHTCSEQRTPRPQYTQEAFDLLRESFETINQLLNEALDVFENFPDHSHYAESALKEAQSMLHGALAFDFEDRPASEDRKNGN